MSINSLPVGTYRIRQAGAKSEVANLISNGKKCHYVQIGTELFDFESLVDAQKFVSGKGLVADSMSMDFGSECADPGDDDADTSTASTE